MRVLPTSDPRIQRFCLANSISLMLYLSAVGRSGTSHFFMGHTALSGLPTASFIHLSYLPCSWRHQSLPPQVRPLEAVLRVSAPPFPWCSLYFLPTLLSQLSALILNLSPASFHLSILHLLACLLHLPYLENARLFIYPVNMYWTYYSMGVALI